MEIVHGELLVYGHSFFNLFGDVALAVGPFFPLFWFHVAKRKIWKGVCAYFFLIFLPNSMYLSTEIRHLFVHDGIADNLDSGAVATFCAISLAGLVLAVMQICLAILATGILKRNAKISIVALSFASAFGTALGLNGLTSLAAVEFSPRVIGESLALVASWKWDLLIVSLSILLSALTFAAWSMLKNNKRFA